MSESSNLNRALLEFLLPEDFYTRLPRFPPEGRDFRPQFTTTSGPLYLNAIVQR